MNNHWAGLLVFAVGGTALKMLNSGIDWILWTPIQRAAFWQLQAPQYLCSVFPVSPGLFPALTAGIFLEPLSGAVSVSVPGLIHNLVRILQILPLQDGRNNITVCLLQLTTKLTILDPDHVCAYFQDINHVKSSVFENFISISCSKECD